MIEHTVKVHTDGSKEWWFEGKRHCTHGPAIEWADGPNSWWFEGERHRTDGPAIERTDGSKSWYLNGKEFTEEEHRKAVSKSTCAGKVVEIDGVKYALKEV